MSMLSLGIDLGTSGIRSAVVDAAGTVVSMARAEYGPQDPDNIDAQLWWDGAAHCITNQIRAMRDIGLDPRQIAHIGVDGTSGSMVLVDADLTPVTRGLMYNSSGFTAEAEAIARHAPDSHITRGTGSALARMMCLQAADTDGRAVHMLHQADFVTAKLLGPEMVKQGGWSDENNALKTGYDPETKRWPAWAAAAGVRIELLPKVKPAGDLIAPIAADVATYFGLSKTAQIHAGTTDSIAAFLACAPLRLGAAVTSLGTTMAIKLLSPTRIDAPEIGLYSHKLGDYWLVGGASNSGGGVLKHFFSVEELQTLSAQIDPETASDLDYYPLLKPGERFPVNDVNLAPRLAPRPQSDVVFLHGLMENIARIEAQCYAAMAEFGAVEPDVIYTAGGGASNPIWGAIRTRVIGVKIESPKETEAAVGIARLISVAS
jgi:sugar (pentulose or hexulose) kinase